MIGHTKFISANLNKSSGTQLSFLNDKDIKKYSALLITEPHILNVHNKPAIHQHRNWTTVTPTIQGEDSVHHAFRTLILVNKNISFIQIPVDSSDITAGIIHTNHSTIFVASVYILGKNRDITSRRTLARAVETRLATLDVAITTAKAKYGPTLTLVIGGDFNRHDPVWGGDTVPTNRYQDEGEPILQWMHENSLFSTLERGAITCWHGRHGTTIDLLLLSQHARDRLNQCRVHDTKHGSDHEAIVLVLTDQPPSTPNKGKLNFRRTDWEELNKDLHQWKPQNTTCNSLADIEDGVSELQEHLLHTLKKYTLDVKDSPSMKAWWDEELTTLCKVYTRLRNWDNDLRRWGGDRRESKERAKVAKNVLHTAIRGKKRTHWNEFIGKADNIWKAARYLDPQPSAFSNIPVLVTKRAGTEVEVESNEDKAAALLETFFPPVPEGWKTDDVPEHTLVHLEDPDITEVEVRGALARLSPWKAPGIDGIPNVVWKETWETLGQHITNIFNASYQLGHVPRQWRMARILPLRKPGKPDYRVAKAYRPISLLATLGKLMELVLARRLSYWAETFNLLPETQFGARPRRSCEQALILLTEKIKEAWQNQKVLSLVSFDVKGAYNGVPRQVLISRLRAKGIPARVT